MTLGAWVLGFEEMARLIFTIPDSGVDFLGIDRKDKEWAGLRVLFRREEGKSTSSR